jgi:hypothetical protein
MESVKASFIRIIFIYQVSFKSVNVSKAEICASAPAQARTHKLQDDLINVLFFAFNEKSSLERKLYIREHCSKHPLILTVPLILQ